MSDLRGLLRTGSEPERLAYVLGAMGAVEALQEEAEGRQTENPVRKYTNVSQLVTDYGLSTAGEAALPALLGVLEVSVWVRRNATEALGILGDVSAVAHWQSD